MTTLETNADQARADDLNYFIAVHYDPMLLSKLVSAFINAGWRREGELSTFSGVSHDSYNRIHYVQVLVR